MNIDSSFYTLPDTIQAYIQAQLKRAEVEFEFIYPFPWEAEMSQKKTNIDEN